MVAQQPGGHSPWVKTDCAVVQARGELPGGALDYRRRGSRVFIEGEAVEGGAVEGGAVKGGAVEVEL